MDWRRVVRELVVVFRISVKDVDAGSFVWGIVKRPFADITFLSSRSGLPGRNWEALASMEDIVALSVSVVFSSSAEENSSL